MTLSLTCACNAHLEVDDAFAGKTITCPDCQRPLQVPRPQSTTLRTSGLAVVSLVLALVGAFTVLGTLLAALLGLLALLSIKKHPDQLAGKAYAVAGIVLGVTLTGLSLFAYTSVELFGLDSLLREPQWAGKLDYNGPLEIVSTSDGYAITRPSRQWGVLKNQSADDFGWPQRVPSNLLLVNVAESGYIACVPMTVSERATLQECKTAALNKFRDTDLASDPGRRRKDLGARVEVRSTKDLATVGETEGLELLVDKSVHGVDRTYLLRVVKKRNDGMMYLVAGGSARDRFARVEADVHKALDSFRLMERGLPKDWNW